MLLHKSVKIYLSMFNNIKCETLWREFLWRPFLSPPSAASARPLMWILWSDMLSVLADDPTEWVVPPLETITEVADPRDSCLDSFPPKLDSPPRLRWTALGVVAPSLDGLAYDDEWDDRESGVFERLSDFDLWSCGESDTAGDLDVDWVEWLWRRFRDDI